jgi:NAD(P)-dependent dehydrogenase (short-subunit alcohol dehydrogenase family)
LVKAQNTDPEIGQNSPRARARRAAGQNDRRVVLFLASPLAAYVTGHTIVADGGLTL